MQNHILIFKYRYHGTNYCLRIYAKDNLKEYMKNHNHPNPSKWQSIDWFVFTTIPIK